MRIMSALLARSMMECPAPVRAAIERIQLEIPAQGDDALVKTWLDWYVQLQMQPEEKWSPAKRLKSSVDESRISTVS